MEMEKYSELHRKHTPKYEFGTRVFGYWNKIPFIGTLYGDTLVSESVGPQFNIFLDLPLKYKDKIYTVLVDKQSNFKKLKPLTKYEF